MINNSRKNAILDIINKKEIETQDELTLALKEEGFNVTQATVSRDIKQLGLVKVAGLQKKYKYVLSSHEESISSRFLNIFKESVTSINHAKNLIVVKCMSGSASSIGMMVDKLNMKEILGSVAGDDTLLIVVDTDSNVLKVVEKLKGFIN